MASLPSLPHHRPGMRHAALFVFCLVCLIAVAAPEYAGLGNRVRPMWLGLPFSLIWNVLWVGLSFFGLGLYHLTDRQEG